jgi:predicted nucleic acid-binding protein
MRAKVVDSSAVCAVIFLEPGAEKIQTRLDASRVIAPELLAFEVSNVFVTKCRTRTADIGILSQQFDAFLDAQLEYRVVDFEAVAEIAIRTKLSAYDASYLYLAQKLDSELVTLDRRLEQVARSLGVRT